jgi:hypothetical protein
MPYEFVDEAPQGRYEFVDEPVKPKGSTAQNIAGGLLRGAGSIGATLLSPIDAAARALNQGKPVEIGGVPLIGVDRRKLMDEALRGFGVDAESLAYQGGKLGAEVAGTAGVGGALAKGLTFAPKLAAAVASGGMSAPGANMATRMAGGAITGGASGALINPDDALMSAGVSAALPGVAKGLGALGRGIGTQFAPSREASPLVQKALDMGAPLGVADIAEGKFTKAVRSVLNDAPLTGSIGAAQNEAKQKWFNRAVGEVFDAADDKLTPEVMDAAKKKMGSEFDRIWSNNNLVVDNNLLDSLNKTRKSASMLPKSDRTRVLSMIDDFENQIAQDANGSIVIPGDVANRYQSTIRKTAESAQGFLKEDLSRLRSDILGAFNRSVSADDAAALSLTQKKYKAFKTVEPLLAKGEAGIAGREAGDVPASLLPGAVFGSYKNNVANSPLADLSKIGSKFIVDRVPQTGGSARALIQNSAIGSALGLGMFSNPMLAAPVIPLGMGLNKALGSPALARAVANPNMAMPRGLLDFGYEATQKALPALIAQ